MKISDGDKILNVLAYLKPAKPHKSYKWEETSSDIVFQLCSGVSAVQGLTECQCEVSPASSATGQPLSPLPPLCPIPGRAGGSGNPPPTPPPQGGPPDGAGRPPGGGMGITTSELF